MHFVQTIGFHCTNYAILVHEVSQWRIRNWNGSSSVPVSLTAMFYYTGSFALCDWFASSCDIFNRPTKDTKWRGKMFHLLKDDSSRNLYPWAVLRIWCQNGNNVHLDTNLGNNTSDLCMASHKQNHIFLQRGEKVFTHFVYEMTNNWPPHHATTTTPTPPHPDTVFLSNYDDFGNSA